MSDYLNMLTPFSLFKGHDALEIRLTACRHIETMIFSHPSSRTYFNDADLPLRLARITDSLPSSNSESESARKQVGHFLERSARIILCLQEHEVFPRTVSYFKELDSTMLDMIFNYLRCVQVDFS